MKYFVTVIWTHCSWKSSYARELLDYDNCHSEIKTPEWYKITLWKDVFSIWHYHAICWWGDWFWKLSFTKKWIIESCERYENIMIWEWILFLSVPVFDVFRKVSQISWRQVVILYLYVSIEEATKRLIQRNWWKSRKDWIVKKKIYYDKRIKELEILYPEFRFIFINTEEISPKDAVEHIKKEILV